MPPKVDKKIILNCVKTFLRHKGYYVSAAAELGISASTLQSRILIAKRLKLINQQDIPNKGNRAKTNIKCDKKWEIDDNKKSGNKVIWSIDDRVQTVEDAVAKAGVDLDIWEVERSIVNSWEVAMKGDIDDNGLPKTKTTPLWQVKVWLSRKIQKIYADAAFGLMSRMTEHSPAYKPIKRMRLSDPHMLEVSIFDLHLGKLAWDGDTQNTYNLKAAERVFENAVVDMVARASNINIERILFPLGQDFFHIDNIANSTVNGTSQDTDGRYTKIFMTGTIACVKAIDYLRTVAPVKVAYVPGNHDRTSAWHLVSYLDAWYRNDKEVEIDMTPTTRKYELYGCNLIGLTHGDEEPHRDLPTIMAGEEPQKWAQSTCREWHLGHYHKKKETTHVTGDTFGPMHIRVLPSLSGTDSWHYRKGYVKGRRAAEGYLWNKKLGYAGHYNVHARD